MSNLVTVVVPCFNEEDVIAETHARLSAALAAIPAIEYEILYVDDGSADRTAELLRGLRAGDRRVRVVQLSRNFGHQIAVTAGIEHATGDAVVLIDADLQDPPEVIGEMVDRWREGYEVAYGVRTDREGESAFKRWTASVFYRLMSKVTDTDIPVDTGDFRLMDRKVVDALLAMPERDRFVRGMVSWTGFRQVGVPYRRAARFAGESKYPIGKMLRLAIDGIASFSAAPLTIATYLGFFASAVALLGMAYALVLRVFTSNWVTGWTGMMLAILFLGGIQMISLGIIGEYVGRIYGESKRRPLYLVQERLGFEAPVALGTPAIARRGATERRLSRDRRRTARISRATSLPAARSA